LFSFQKTNVSFKKGETLALVHSYPAVNDHLDETDSSGAFSKTENAVNRERERLSTVEIESKVETIENINFVTEGDDFSSQESGSALLF